MSRRGFTLIELLVVIAIIAILAAILMPVMGSAKKAGQTSACLNNMGQLAMAVTLYGDDNNSKCVPVLDRWRSQGQIITWRWLVKKYTTSQKVYVCPSAPTEAGTIAGSSPAAKSYPYDVWGSYALNYNLFAAQGFPGQNSWGDYPAWSIGYPHASKLVMITHAKSSPIVHVMMLKNPDLTTYIPYSHNGMTAVAFLDGHVRTIKIRKTLGATASEFMWFDDSVYSQPGAWRDPTSAWPDTWKKIVDDIGGAWPSNYGGN